MGTIKIQGLGGESVEVPAFGDVVKPAYRPIPESEQPWDWSQRKIAPFPGEYIAADQPAGGWIAQCGCCDYVTLGIGGPVSTWRRCDQHRTPSRPCPFRAAFRGGGE